MLPWQYWRAYQCLVFNWDQSSVWQEWVTIYSIGGSIQTRCWMGQKYCSQTTQCLFLDGKRYFVSQNWISGYMSIYVAQLSSTHCLLERNICVFYSLSGSVHFVNLTSRLKSIMSRSWQWDTQEIACNTYGHSVVDVKTLAQSNSMYIHT